MKKGIIVLLCFLPLTTIASNKKDYMLVHYNIESISQKMTHEQCQKWLNVPVYYDINDDKVNDEKTDNVVQRTQYKRLATTFLSHDRRLFYGQTEVHLQSKDNQPMTVKEHYSMVLNLNTMTVRGSSYIPGYCKSNIIGVKQKLHVWHNSHEPKIKMKKM